MKQREVFDVIDDQRTALSRAEREGVGIVRVGYWDLKLLLELAEQAARQQVGKSPCMR